MRKIVLPIALSLLLFALVLDARLLASTRGSSPAAQAAATGQPSPVWETYTFKGEEFSVALPEMPVLDHAIRDIERLPSRRRKVRDYAAYSDGVVYLIRTYDKPREGEDFDYFFKDFMGKLLSASDIVKVEREMTLGKFPGRQYVITRDSSRTTPLSSIYVFLTKQHAYAVRAAGGDDSHPDVRRFIGSFKLANKPAGRQIVDETLLPLSAARDASAVPSSSPDKKSLPTGDPKSNGSAPKTSGDGRGVGAGENPGVGMGSGIGSGIGSGMGTDYRTPESGGGVVDYSRTFMARDVTHKAQVIHKPEPRYTEEARKNQVTGTVRLRLILSASGRVTGIAPYSRLPDGLTETAIRAARHIKFIPAIKDGRRVSQYITIEYNFNIY